MTEKHYIKNTIILFISMIITKIVGALFKIPLANLLGGTGMGYFSSAYGLYSPIFALTAAGIPTVLMRTTARNAATGNLRYAAAVRKYALIVFSSIGLLGTAAVAIFAKPFAEHIACSPQSMAAVVCIAPAVALCCTASVLRGYREGLSDVMPSAAASVAEAVSRAVFGLALSFSVIFYGRYCFENGRAVFGTVVSTEQQAYEASLPYAAAGAILAVSISELCGLISLIISEKRIKKHGQDTKLPARRTYCARNICVQLIKDTAPIAASALVMNFVSFIDLLTVTRAISYSIERHSAYYMENFGGILDYCGGIAGLPNFMYGSYTGIAMSIFMLIPSFAGMTEKTAAPDIAAAFERRDNQVLSDKINLLFRSCALIACPACFGAAALARPILEMLYRSRAAEVSVCLNAFIILCLGGIFMVISSAMFGIFQSIGKAHYPLILMGGSVVIKLLLNPILISIPALNISGAPLSSIIGYAFMTVCGGILLNKSIPQKVSIPKAVIRPLIYGGLCAVGAFGSYLALGNVMNSTLNTIFSTFAGGIIYVILLILDRLFYTSGIISQKNKKKSKKPLEKNAKIG